MEINFKRTFNTNEAPSVAEATAGVLLLSGGNIINPIGMMGKTLRLREEKFCQNLDRIFSLKRQEKISQKVTF